MDSRNPETLPRISESMQNVLLRAISDSHVINPNPLLPRLSVFNPVASRVYPFTYPPLRVGHAHSPARSRDVVQ